MAFDYMLQQPQLDPLSRGLNIGNAINQGRYEQEQRDMQLQQEQQKLQQQKLIGDSMNDLINNPNPTVKDFTRVAMLLPKNESEAMMGTWNAIDKEKQKSALKFGGQVMSAFQSGNSDIGIRLLKERAMSLKNSGDDQQAQAMETWANLAEQNPDMAYKMIGTMISTLPGGKETLEGVGKLGEETRAQELQPSKIEKAAADIGLTKAQTNKEIILAKKAEAEIAKTNAEAGKIAMEAAQKSMEMRNQSPVKLSTAAEKILNDAVVGATNSMNLARQYDNTAKEFREIDATSGLEAKGKEAVKTLFGNQDKITMLRNDYKRLKNSAVINMLPPGPATDKDIEIIASGFPDENASPKHIADFMETMARVQRYEAGMNDVKAEWVQNFGNLGNANRSVQVGGMEVQPGTRFSDFVKENVSSPVEANSQQEIKDQTSKGSQPGMLPEVGTIESGYRFIGGDPATPDSWEKI